MSRFRDLPEFGPTLDAAAERLGISATAIEKDYWVSEVLRVLAREFPNDFIFKGGTSLSKGYRIIERFSEDIDVLVLPGSRGRGATDKLLKQFGSAAATGIDGDASAVGGAETGRHRSYQVSYPATRDATAVVDTSVLLELGVRGGHHPHESVPISGLLADALETVGTDLDEFDDLRPFDVVVLHPGRTLLEKLVHISTAAQGLASDPHRQPDRRSGRHFYDVYQLLGDGRVIDFLSDRPQVQSVIDSIGEVTHAHFGGSDTEVRPADGFAATAAFDTDSDVSRRLRRAYDASMPELYFGSEPLPAWDAISARVAANRGLL